MEYVDGEDLSSVLRRSGRLPRDKALEIARKICAGLAAVHDLDPTVQSGQAMRRALAANAHYVVVRTALKCRLSGK